MVVKNNINRITALYERLSNDDNQNGESNSIINQKEFLEEYATRNGFKNLRHFSDDGFSGKNFNRPGFQEMLTEIENDAVDTVIVKDMSRFGRNYLQVGFYTEMVFPKKKVRFIAVNNNIDSSNPKDNDFTPFLNIMNEWYVKDTSNKIKAIKLAKMREGKRTSGVIPYGYNHDPENKNHLIVDPVAAPVVKHIFELAAEGNGPALIAKQLTKEDILIPSAYTFKYHPEQSNRRKIGNVTTWRASTIGQMLTMREYLGHTILRKSISLDFKTNTRRNATEDELLIFNNTHEPIIDQELWDKAQKMRKRIKKSREFVKHENKYKGIIFCGDCGSSMHYTVHQNGIKTFQCSKYSNRTRPCSAHYIREDALDRIVLEFIQRILRFIEKDEKKFAEELQKEWIKRNANKPDELTVELKALEKRNSEIDSLFTILYNNYINGKVSERQYMTLSQSYDEEQIKNDNRINRIKENIAETKQKPMEIDKFIETIRSYTEPKELTRDMIMGLIDKILIFESKDDKDKKQKHLEIYYNFIGKFELAYTQEEINYMKKLEEEKRKAKYIARKAYSSAYQKNLARKKREEKFAANNGHFYPERNCEYCKEKFWPNRVHQIYCSKECAYEHYKEKKKKEHPGLKKKRCIICGNLFKPKSSHNICCSDECRRKRNIESSMNYHQKHRDSIRIKDREKYKKMREAIMKENEGHLWPKKKCEYCGIEFWPYRSSQKYCSKKCGKAMLETKRLGRDIAEKEGHRHFKNKCVICGKEFWPNGPTTLCCSSECDRKRINKRSQEYRDKYKEKRLAENNGHMFPSRTCAFCKKEFWPNCVHQRYCSKNCQENNKVMIYNKKNPSEKEGHKYFKKICIVCGKEFWPNGPNAKTCSVECSRKNINKLSYECQKRKKARIKQAVSDSVGVKKSISHLVS